MDHAEHNEAIRKAYRNAPVPETLLPSGRSVPNIRPRGVAAETEFRRLYAREPEWGEVEAIIATAFTGKRSAHSWGQGAA